MREVNLLYSFARLLCVIVFSLLFRVRISGLEKAEKRGPVLLCANHVGIMDMFLISYAYNRIIHYMAKVELFKNPLLGFLIKAVGSFPVRRGEGDVSAVKTVLRLLREGKVVGIFPEGTRTRGVKPEEVRKGAAVFALRSEAVVQPVAIKGRYKIFSKIEIIFGSPYKVNNISGKKHQKEDLERISKKIIDSIYELIEERDLENANNAG